MNKECHKCGQSLWTRGINCVIYCPRCDLDDANNTADDTQAGGSHYKDMSVQPWNVMEDILTPEEFAGFLKGNMIKYAMRQGKKDSPDAEKYHHYKQKLAEVKALGTKP